MILQTYDKVSYKEAWLTTNNYKTYNKHKALEIAIMLYKLGPNVGYKVFNCTEEEYLSGLSYKYLVKQWFNKDLFKGDIE